VLRRRSDDIIDIRVYDKHEIDKYDVPIDVEPLGKLKFSVRSRRSCPAPARRIGSAVWLTLRRRRRLVVVVVVAVVAPVAVAAGGEHHARAERASVGGAERTAKGRRAAAELPPGRAADLDHGSLHQGLRVPDLHVRGARQATDARATSLEARVLTLVLTLRITRTTGCAPRLRQGHGL